MAHRIGVAQNVAVADPARFERVTTLGVDEGVVGHVSGKPIEDGGRGPKELTRMVDLTRYGDDTAISSCGHVCWLFGVKLGWADGVGVAVQA